jgi:cyclopropane-fatty-acyl-phospholipid synthase
MVRGERGGPDVGASADAIRAHYDLSSDFYRLWLDASLTYSCAMWEPGDTLERAQLRKLDFHVEQSRAAGCDRVLDVGCGWGSMLRRLVDAHGVTRAVGLTLSKAQWDYITSLGDRRLETRAESWAEHAPSEPYDAIVCIGALEHFVRPETPATQRIEAYRRFFAKCRDILRPGGWLSLQTIAYGVGGFVKGAISTIFPQSDLPRLSQIAEAAERQFEIVTLRNEREDYAQTCREWLHRLRNNRARAETLVGREVTTHYERFLDASSRGFETQVFCLYRIGLRRVDADL